MFKLLFPQGHVLFEELNDAFGVSELLLFKFVNLFESSLESVVSGLDGILGSLEYFVLEDGVIKRKAKFSRIARCKGSVCKSICVSLRCCSLSLFKFFSLSAFCYVAPVIANHLCKESLSLALHWLGKDCRLHNIHDILTIDVKEILHFLLITCECFSMLLVLRVLFDCTNCTNSSSLALNQVFEGN